MELIEVIDTAVKVGLGAIISGFTTYRVTKLNHNSDRKKESGKRAHEALIQTTENIDRYLNCLARCIARLDGYARSGVPSGKFPDEILMNYRDVDKELISARPDLAAAASRLRLIGERDAALSVENLGRFENSFRTKVIFEKQQPTAEELKLLQKEYQKIKEAIYEALNAVYKKLLD